MCWNEQTDQFIKKKDQCSRSTSMLFCFGAVSLQSSVAHPGLLAPVVAANDLEPFRVEWKMKSTYGGHGLSVVLTLW